MDQLRVCVVISEEHSKKIHYPVVKPDWEEVKQAKTGRIELVELKDEEINRNLHDFLIIPKTKEGIVLLYEAKLFQHMKNFINLFCRKVGRLEPSSYLDLEISTDQSQILNLSKQDLRRSTNLQDSIQKSSRKLATRKLNVIVNMVGHCSVLTNEKISREIQRTCNLQKLMNITYKDRNNSIP